MAEGWTLVTPAPVAEPKGWTLVQPAAPDLGADFRTINDPVGHLKTESAAEGDQLLANMRNIRDWLGEKIEQWGKAGPHAVVEGLRQLQAGEYSKGLHQAVTGSAITAAPMFVPALAGAAVAAPVATAASLVGGMGAAMVAEPVGTAIGREVGLTPDQAQLVGDVFGGAAGYRGSKLTPGQLARVADTVMHPARAVGRTVGTVVDVATETIAARRAARAAEQALAEGAAATAASPPHLDRTVSVPAGSLTQAQIAERLRSGTGTPTPMRARARVYAPRPTPTVVEEPPVAPVVAAPAPVEAAPAAVAPVAAPVVAPAAAPPAGLTGTTAELVQAVAAQRGVMLTAAEVRDAQYLMRAAGEWDAAGAEEAVRRVIRDRPRGTAIPLERQAVGAAASAELRASLGTPTETELAETVAARVAEARKRAAKTPASAEPAEPAAVTLPAQPGLKPVMSAQMALNEVALAARRAGLSLTREEVAAVAQLVQQGVTPAAAIRQWQVAIGAPAAAPVVAEAADPAAALAARLGTLTDTGVDAAIDARWQRGEIKTPSAATARRMKAEADARLAAARGSAPPPSAILEAPNAQPVPSPPAPVDEGAIAARLHDEPAAVASGGPLQSGRRAARPRRAPAERSTNADVLGDLVDEAVAAGHTGDPAALRQELTERMQLIAEGDAAFDQESGHSPDVLLRAIAKLGGIGFEKETALKGEIRWLKDFRDALPTKAGKGNLAKPRYADTVRGVPGVFRDKNGLPLDDVVTRLRQDPRFAHIESPDDLIDEIRRAATTPRDDRIAADRLRASLGSRWWERMTPAALDAEVSFNPAELEAPAPVSVRSAVQQYDAARQAAREAEAVWQRAQTAYRRQTIDEAAYREAQAAVTEARHAVVQADRAMRGKTGT